MPSHGSLTKAGKVRSHTLELQKAGAMPRAKPRRNLAPRPRNRKEYIRFLAVKLAKEILALSREYGLPPEKILEQKLRYEKNRDRKQALELLLAKPELMTYARKR